MTVSAGSAKPCAIAALVERATGLAMLVALPAALSLASSSRSRSSVVRSPSMPCAPVMPTAAKRRSWSAQRRYRSAAVSRGVASRTRLIAPFSRGSPVGAPSASTTISACSGHVRGRRCPLGRARAVSPALWKSRNVKNAGPPPVASAISSPLMPVAAKAS
jgi:hypothetical protein